MPTNISQANTHRLLHLNALPDHQRLEEMTADAIAHLRSATEAFAELPKVERAALDCRFGDIALHAMRGDVLSPDLLTTLPQIIRAIDVRMSGGSTDEALLTLRDHLRQSHTLAQRVVDLVMAETQIDALRVELSFGLMDDGA